MAQTRTYYIFRAYNKTVNKSYGDFKQGDKILHIEGNVQEYNSNYPKTFEFKLDELNKHGLQEAYDVDPVRCTGLDRKYITTIISEDIAGLSDSYEKEEKASA